MEIKEKMSIYIKIECVNEGETKRRVVWEDEETRMVAMFQEKDKWNVWTEWEKTVGKKERNKKLNSNCNLGK